MKKMTAMQTFGATLGTVGSVLEQVQGVTEITASYVQNWKKDRENALRISKTERIAQLADIANVLDAEMYQKAKEVASILDGWDI